MAGVCDLFFPPLRCLKSTIFGGTIATVVVGVLSIFIVVYAFLISSIWAQFSSQIRNELISIILCSSLMITLIGVSGIYGITNNKPCFLCLYSLGSVIFMVLFLFMGVFATVYPKALINSCQTSKLNSTLEFQQAVDTAQDMLCKTCPCYFSTMYNPTYYNQTEQNWLENNLYNTSQTQQSWPENAQNCTQWTNITNANVDTLSLLEGIFQCSGWCEQNGYPNLYYLFTNLNQGSSLLIEGKPKAFCYTMVVQFFKQFGSLLEASSYLVAIVLFVVVATTFCLCVHPKRLSSSSNSSLKERLLQVNAAILDKTEQ